MSFFRRIVGRTEEDREPRLISGDEAARETSKLVATSEKEGWSPTYSIVLNCAECSSQTSIGVGESGYHFVSPDGSFHPGGFVESLKCSRCEGTRFLLALKPTTFHEALEKALSELEATEQSPGVGFREDGTGHLIVDRTLMEASSFDVLWERIRDTVDQRGNINTRFDFDMLHGRYLDTHIPAVLHYSYKTNTTVTVLRDGNGSYWYSVER